MNTQKQVFIMAALLMMMLLSVAVYAAWYPSRADTAEQVFERHTAERGSILFARNCRLCHGDLGEGGSLGGRLPAAPPLNRPDLQGFENANVELASEVGLNASTIEVTEAEVLAEGDIILIDEERMEVTGVDGTTVEVERAVQHTEAAGHFPGARIYAFDDAALAQEIDLLTNTIVCGRVGTAMPAWGQSQGGPLSDEQIRQLVVLITTARWDFVEHEIAIEDAVSSRLTEPVTADATQINVTDVTRFDEDDAIRLGDERLRIVGLPDFEDGATNIPGTLEVERGIRNTFAAQHSDETEIFRFPEVPEPAATLQTSCGQTAQAPAPQGTPGTIEDFDGDQTVEISAVNVQFDTDQITVQADGEVRVRFTNLEDVPHNVAFYMSETDLTPVSEGAVGITFNGTPEGVVDDTVFEIPEPGEYFFRCDVHPTLMVGTFTVE